MSTRPASRLWSSHTANWLKLPAGPSAFELKVQKLGLADSPEKWASSAKLRAFARANKNKRYIPEELLKELGISVWFEEW